MLDYYIIILNYLILIMFYYLKKRVKQFPLALEKFYYKTKYSNPFSNIHSIKLSSEAEIIYSGLKKNGIVKLNQNFFQEADYIEEVYFGLSEYGKLHGDISSIPLMSNINNQYWEENGRPFAYYISFKDKKLEKIFLNEDIATAICKYMKTQPYYRSQPVIAKHEWSGETNKLYQSKFHVDGSLKQVSMMLLVNDITEKDTHMEYAIGSNKLGKKDYSYDEKKVLKEYPRQYPLIGKKGSLFLFDAGSGYHRAIYRKNSIRKILHVITTGGDRIFPERFDRVDDWDSLKKQHSVVQKLFDRIGIIKPQLY